MTYFLVFAVSAMVSLAAGAAVRRAAIRFGAVVPIRPDRWHRQPTPTFGGVAIFLGVAAALALFGSVWWPDLRVTGTVLGVGAGLFVIGWYDDVRPLFAAGKIVTSLAAAAFFIFTLAYVVPELKPSASAGLLSLAAILLFAGLINAVNLLDNMDGLAAGTSALSAVALAFTFQAALGPGLVTVLFALAGGLAGFLVWNRHPAKLFMGNCGSLAMGSLLAASAIVAVARVGTVRSAIAAGFILAAPIFDTSFVILLRRMAGRSTTKGYIDHVSHRLVSAGASEPRAVLVFYLLSAAGGAAGYLLQTEGAGTWPIPILVGVAVVMLGLYLARVSAYSGQDFVALQDASFTPLLSDLTMRWHLGEVLLDLVLIATCYYSAYYLRFEDREQLTAFLWSFTASLPLILGCQIAALYGSGLYSRSWSTFGFHDLWPVVRGVVVGSMLTIVLITFLYKNTPELLLFSKGVFFVEALLLMAAIVATRSSFRILKRVAHTAGPSRRRVMIYGAGARGQLLVREMMANPAWLRHPVGFFDDNVSMHGRRLVGVPVRGSLQDMPQVLKKLAVHEVLLSSPSINGLVESQIREICGTLQVPVRRLYMEIQ